MPTGTPITMKSIADELGVSVTTVARALGGGERISQDTIRKVNEAADRLGYVRNLDAVKLRTGQSFVVMTFLRFSSEEEVGDSGSVGLLNGIHKRLAGSDYSVRATPVTMEESGLDLVKQVVNGRNADGIILDHTTPQDERVKFLQEAGIPFVTFGRTAMPDQHAYFDLDNEFAAYQGTKAMLDQGYRRIALLDADEGYSFVAQRRIGYMRALEEAGILFDDKLVRHIAQTAPAARHEARDLVSNGTDAIVCVNEVVFLGARAGVRDQMGADAETIGYSVRSGTNLGAYLSSPISNVHFSRTDAGWTLADLLLKRISGAPADQCQKIGRTDLR
ncbi:MAG: LacI family DNA-binding transcriptional regulator [Roseibium sp.]